MTFEILRRFRSLATLGVLLVLLLVGVSWGWSAVTAPLPESEDPPVCEDTMIAAGEKIYPDEVTVSVLNAGNKEGLAGRVLQELDDKGFVTGENDNAPTRPQVVGAEIWTADPDSAAARLVASYLSKGGQGVNIRDVETDTIGITVVVGDEFTAVVKGRKAITADAATTICSPTE